MAIVGYPNKDVAELFEQTGQRLVDRMAGLTDDEWIWRPISDDEKVTVRWRLDHIAEAVGGRRNWEWVGAPASDAPKLSPAESARTAVKTAQSVMDEFVALIRRPDLDLDQPIGPIAGPYGDVPRRGLVLHTLDELIHHAAETALIRDLYAAR
ncbi:DinB family protein [Microlunatus sp. Gsoil 973]|uniref:DinB family protein n=1 Tax=Microlunatus sp. Gsoil 973 TaxID=2672569 RepID=UPI0012B47876|nr:DinB family protein [Microlunatus sp. Gsoil 973]QGN35354.1 DinB family protein [Microlunatus sp. Gsoil 973]